MLCDSELRKYADKIAGGTIAALFPGLGLGALLWIMNSEPYIPAGESFWISFKSAISTTGLWMSGIGLEYIFSESVFNKDPPMARSHFSLLAGLVMIPIHTYTLYHNMINHLDERKEKVFDLEFRLNEARNYLNSKQQESEREDMMIIY